MSEVMNALQAVLSIMLMIGLGMLLTKLKWIDERTSKFLSKLVVKVALPATVLNNMLTKFTKASLAGMAAGLISPYAAMLIGGLLGWYVAKLLKIPRRRKGTFVCMFTLSNAVFVGLPVCNALFGEDSSAYTLLYYIANTTLFWSIGNALISHDGNLRREELAFGMIPSYLFSKDKANARFIPAKNALERLKKLIPIPLLALALSLILLMCEITLPQFVMDSAKYVGNMVTPLSLLFLGYCLMNMIDKRQFRFDFSILQ